MNRNGIFCLGGILDVATWRTFFGHGQNFYNNREKLEHGKSAIQQRWWWWGAIFGNAKSILGLIQFTQ